MMRLAALFSDKMILQQEMPVPVWGWGEPGQEIKVSIEGQEKRTIVDGDGKWRVELGALAVNAEGLKMHVDSGAESLIVRDILVGEVWVCSGQSNMEWTLDKVINAEAELAAADYPTIRTFTVQKVAEPEPQEDVIGEWTVATPEEAAVFSGVGFFFAKELQQNLNVPIGLVHTSWGGTYAEAWTSRGALIAHPSYTDVIERYEKTLENGDTLYEDFQRDFVDNQEVSNPPEKNAGWLKGWASASFDDSDWEELELPRLWTAAGHDYNGVFWFRREVVIPSNWEGRQLTLCVGACDKADITYFNNREVGRITLDWEDGWDTQRVYPVPADLATAGKAVITTRVYSHLYGGGMSGPAANMCIFPVDSPEQAISLVGPWKYVIEHNFGRPRPAQGPGNANSPYILYSSMLAPIMPYAIRGATWYQGESNADNAYAYRELFSLMIEDWRRQWGQGDFPFLFVQLANFRERNEEPVNSNWAELREAQTMALQLPNTGMALAIDIGEADDIHPRNKQGVGQRLAYWALGTVYEQDRVISGPLYREASFEDGKVRISFDHIGGGLVCKGERPAGFSIAGDDQNFVWADAEIDGDDVVVSSPQVPEPASVRYGWADNPEIGLYNAAGLPASPFRTDSWRGITQY